MGVTPRVLLYAHRPRCALARRSCLANGRSCWSNPALSLPDRPSPLACAHPVLHARRREVAQTAGPVRLTSAVDSEVSRGAGAGRGGGRLGKIVRCAGQLWVQLSQTHGRLSSAAGYVAKYIAKFQSTPASFPASDAGRLPVHRVRDRFQSTPASFPASDTAPRSTPSTSRWFQSTPASFPASDAVQTDEVFTLAKFQSTPASFPASDGAWLPTARRPVCFNPRPPVSRRATLRLVAELFLELVSIHARQFPGERRPVARSRSQ
ncbi:hypothetical protein Lcho_1150 [Leptothrix cholodnii SP-6]|uniref:Uncharacterized protein n=1 Tax=Leptothrix cholodnii (strain ATCC 51168 / LMG 8142 / SP-6) TaxID=395495 RepID=B1Y4I0_LEPCP|nr:hypothetical protein Lcho_1150 [Leptothrix cholodnii SP-6]